MNGDAHAGRNVIPPVVLDTNVLVGAGFNPRSASARILDAVKRQKVRMMWDGETRREILRIMQQIPRLRSLILPRLEPGRRARVPVTEAIPSRWSNCPCN